MPLSEAEKQELLTTGPAIAKDMRYIETHRHNPFENQDGTVELDRLLEFLNSYNEFINHEPKPFRPMKDDIIKL